MSDLLAWLGYAVAAGLAFAAVYKGWRITLAMLAGAIAGLLIAMVGVFTAPADQRSPWLNVEVGLNGSLALIFAAAGAAVALALRHSRES